MTLATTNAMRGCFCQKPAIKNGIEIIIKEMKRERNMGIINSEAL